MEKVVGYLQYEPEFGATEANRKQVDALLAGVERADLLVLPELALSGYNFTDADETRSLAEPISTGASSEWLRAHASRLGAAIVMGYPELAPEGCYNSAMIALPDGRMHNYRKLHLFSREKNVFLPGNRTPEVIETPAGRVGTMICFDWFFPEVARVLALGGAQIIAHPSNLVLDLCQRAMFARCVENRVFGITANRIGTEERAGRRLRFTGASQILNVRGDALSRAPEDTPHMEFVKINPADADNKRVTDLNDLFEDRRTEFYGPIG